MIVREITKTKLSRRTLAIPAAVVLLLRAQKARVLEQALAWGSEYRRGPRFLFPVNGGEPMRPFSLTDRLQPAAAPGRNQGRAAGARLAPRHRHPDDRRRRRREDHAEPDLATQLATITLALYADKVDERDRAAGEALAGYLIPSNKRKS